MVGVALDDDRLLIGAGLVVSFQRTLRVPDDSGTYPLPPTLGRFPLHTVDSFRDRLPEGWRGVNHFFLPMYQREALWLAFDATPWRPSVVKIGVGGVNAITGEPLGPELSATGSQDYVVCPPQLWVDGVNAKQGQVRQFVSTPLGTGGTIEAQLGGTDEVGGIQLVVFDAKPGTFPDSPPDEDDEDDGFPSFAVELGVGAGGFIVQKIYADPHGVGTWQAAPAAEVFVHILNSAQYLEVTGTDPPPTPVDTKRYIDAGLPWFEAYDEGRSPVPPSSTLEDVPGIDTATRHELGPDAGENGVQNRSS